MCCPLFEIHFPNRTAFLCTMFMLIIGIFQAFHLYTNLLQLISHHDGVRNNNNSNIKVFHKQPHRYLKQQHKQPHRYLKQQQKQQEKEFTTIPSDDAVANNIVIGPYRLGVRTLPFQHNDDHSSSLEKESSKSSICSNSRNLQLGNDVLETSILPSTYVSRSRHAQEKNDKEEENDDKDLFSSTNDHHIPFQLN